MPAANPAQHSPTSARPTPSTMRAAVRRRWGTTDDVEVTTVDRPTCADDEVLVEVHAAATNALDWHMLTGTPWFLRLQAGLRRPKNPVLGADFAGVVCDVGKDVENYSVGDEVFGETHAAFAEYLTAKPKNIAPRPRSLSMSESAGLPVAGLTALQGLRDRAEVKTADRVLVIGASGGVGVMTVQIAKAFGAHVTAVCSERNRSLVADLGADETIDYQTTAIDQWGNGFDVVMDIAGTYPLNKTRKRLRDGGRYVLIGGSKKGRLFGPMAGFVRMMLLNPFVPQKMSTFVAEALTDDLRTLADLADAGQLRVPIDQTFDLDQAREALVALATWRTRGKSIITVDAAPSPEGQTQGV